MNAAKKILALNAPEAALKLLGYELVRRTQKGRIRVRIVETEAYTQDEPASHSFSGRTNRTAPMFEAGGIMYVYFTYGMHHCLNLVTGMAGRGEGVLIRAAEPLEGLDLIRANRGGIADDIKLTNGPAKLAQALGIGDTTWSGQKFSGATISILKPSRTVSPANIVATTRIGIKQAADLPWRFYELGNRFVSKP